MTPDPAPGVFAGIMDVMAASVLAVEDDDGIRTTMRMALEDEGFEVFEAASGEAALDAFDRQPADLVLVDLMLPGMNGFDLCRSLRSASDVPIVVVTARVDSHDVVAGLEAGADDYVRKPFAVKELAARIRALLRRSQRDGEASGVPAEVYRFEEIEVVPDAGVVRRGGEELSVTKTEFRLLCELAVNRGLVLSREQLLERVWGYDYFGDQRLVDSHIRRLRMKIEEDPSDPRLLVTVRGLGYKLGQ
jgi:DNA-binding response OmpR family regulator